MSLRIKMVAKLTGIREATLRVWERRYGFPAPARATNGYRTYSRDDAEAVRRVARLLEQGYMASEAIDLVRTTPLDTLPMRQRIEERFWSAVMVLDADAADLALEEAGSAMEPPVFCDDFLLPLLRKMPSRLDVAREHLASAVIRQRLRGLISAVRERATGPGVVLACPPDEQHEGGLLAVALHLRRRGWRVMLLGADTPVGAIRAAAHEGRASIVGLSLVREFGEPEFEALVRQLAKEVAVPVVLGGPAARDHLRLVHLFGAFFADSAEAFVQVHQRLGVVARRPG